MDKTEQTLSQEETPEQAPQTGYVPRPRWQVWAARIGLILFIFTIIGYYMFIFRGGF